MRLAMARKIETSGVFLVLGEGEDKEAISGSIVPNLTAASAAVGPIRHSRIS